ncbi:MAG: HNH endonuclease [Clostridiales bacterium]
MYELINQYIYPIHSSDNTQKEYLGDKSNQICIFCNHGKDEVTFRKEAHVIPAALGNKTLLNYNECDNCNKLAGKLESELINYLQLERISVKVILEFGKQHTLM